MDLYVFRGLERLLGVFFAGISIFLGYLLFLRLPNQTDSDGKIVLPGGISIFLSRVGPGVFFSLFGTAIIAFSIYEGVDSFEPATTKDASGKTDSTAFRGYHYLLDGIEMSVSDSLEHERLRSEIRGNLRNLDALKSMIRSDLDQKDLMVAESTLRNSKRHLMLLAWKPEWGDINAFWDWLARGEQSPPPEEIESAVKFYSGN